MKVSHKKNPSMKFTDSFIFA